jgi:hypothetical protein
VSTTIEAFQLLVKCSFEVIFMLQPGGDIQGWGKTSLKMGMVVQRVLT